MMSKAKISCRVEATAPGLTLCARVDDTIIFQGDAHDQHDLTIEIDDDERPHVLIFELAGKTQEHTKLDQSGMIISDVVVNISDLSFDGIALGHTFVEKAIYSHDNNGTGAQVQEKFYGTMGCNGTVRLEFTTPIYLWLLENM